MLSKSILITVAWRPLPRDGRVSPGSPKQPPCILRPQKDKGIKPSAFVPGTKSKKHPTLLLAEQLRIEGELAVVQYDMGATTSLVSSSFISKLSLFSQPERVCVSISSGVEGEPVEATLSHELYIRYLHFTSKKLYSDIMIVHQYNIKRITKRHNHT